MNTPAQTYLAACRRLVDVVEGQQSSIEQGADWFAESILAGGLVHVFGTGHSRIMVEEMWPRYGSFPGFHPIVELALTHHGGVVGPGGQRQAMFLENVEGLAERILRNYDLGKADSGLIVSSSGCNVVSIEIADRLRRRGLRTVGLVSRSHAEVSESHDPKGRKLFDVVDLVLDTGAPAGDATVSIEGLNEPVAPTSSVGGCMVVNALKAEVALRLTQAGHPPTVLTASCLAGSERATELFEEAYDEHARRVSKLWVRAGRPSETG